MQINSRRTMKYTLLLAFTIIMMSCEPSDSNNRYESLTNGTIIGVLDTKSSEVFVYDSRTDSWHSIGKPSETQYTRATKPKNKVPY